MHRVFISVTQVDRAYAIALKDLLIAQSSGTGPSWDCYFYEQDALQGGLPRNIAREIESRETFIAIVTPDYFKSSWCVPEHHYAGMLNKQILYFRPTDQYPNLSELEEKLQPALFEETNSSMPPAFGETELRDAQGKSHRVKFAKLAFKHLTERARDPLEMLPQWLDLPTELKKPFPGMTAFTQEMGGIFFGRDAEIAQALRRFKEFERKGSGVFVVQGASGSGKSSFMRAGLLARLARAKDRYFVAETFKPQQGPSQETLSKEKRPHTFFLDAVQGLFDDVKYAELQSDEIKVDGLARVLRARVDDQARSQGLPEGRPIIFPIDQGEELFVGEATNDELDEISEFLKAMEKMAGAGQGIFFFMTARSAEHVLRILNMQVPVDSFPLPRMQLSQLSAIVNGPLQRPEFSHVQFSERAVNILTEQAARIKKRETALPLISHALRELWETGDRGPGARNTIDLTEDYRLDVQLEAKLAAAIEELQGTLSLNPVQLNAVLRNFFFTYFIFPDHNGDVRFKTAYQQFVGDDHKIAETFVRFRLLLGDPSPDAPSYELVHETIAQKWDWMKEWIEERREAFTSFSILNRDAQQWVAKHRNDENIVYSSYHYKRIQSLCDNEPARFARIASDKLGFPVEEPLIGYAARFMSIHTLIEETAKEKEEKVQTQLKALRDDAKRKLNRNNRFWQGGAAIAALFVLAGGYWGHSLYQAQVNARASADEGVVAIRSQWRESEATFARRFEGCWEEIRPLRPTDCDKFRLVISPTTTDEALPGEGQISRTCLYSGAEATTRSYQVRAGALTTESMYSGLPGQWRFVADDTTLLWSAPAGPTGNATGVYRKTDCSAG